MIDVKGEYENPPINVPKIAGVPAINPNAISFPIMVRLDVVLSLDNGPAMAIPSVVLCNANPIIKNVLNAIEPNPTDAPITRPSPKLCNPIPTAIITAIATGFVSLEYSVLFTNFWLK